MITQCVSFISQSIVHFPDRNQLRLALGVLQYHRGSVADAKKTLQALLDDPPAVPNLQGFVEEARKRLNQGDVHKPLDEVTGILYTAVQMGGRS